MGLGKSTNWTTRIGLSQALAWILPFGLLLCAVPIAAAQEAEDEYPMEEMQETSPPEYQPLPSMLTVPSGTLISIRTTQFLSSDRNHAGDLFGAELQQPLVVDGWVAARRGQTVVGRVAVAKKAGRIKGQSELGLELTQLVLVDGQQIPLRTEFMNATGGTSQGRDAQAAGTATGTGAIIGAIAGGGKGAAIGAAVGAGAAVAGVLLTRGRATEIPSESVLTFQILSQVSFSTERSRVAFRPVSQRDYEAGRSLERRPEREQMARPRRRPTLFPYYPRPVFVGYYRFGGRRHPHRW